VPGVALPWLYFGHSDHVYTGDAPLSMRFTRRGTRFSDSKAMFLCSEVETHTHAHYPRYRHRTDALGRPTVVAIGTRPSVHHINTTDLHQARLREEHVEPMHVAEAMVYHFFNKVRWGGTGPGGAGRIAAERDANGRLLLWPPNLALLLSDQSLEEHIGRREFRHRPDVAYARLKHPSEDLAQSRLNATISLVGACAVQDPFARGKDSLHDGMLFVTYRGWGLTAIPSNPSRWAAFTSPLL
jgi:hypothetical protein